MSDGLDDMTALLALAKRPLIASELAVALKSDRGHALCVLERLGDGGLVEDDGTYMNRWRLTDAGEKLATGAAAIAGGVKPPKKRKKRAKRDTAGGRGKASGSRQPVTRSVADTTYRIEWRGQTTEYTSSGEVVAMIGRGLAGPDARVEGIGAPTPVRLDEHPEFAGLFTHDDSRARDALGTLGMGARILVHAGPGCGKTHELTRRAVGLLESCPPERILVISFSRAAVATTRERARAAAERGAERMDALDVRTIDSLAYTLHAGSLEGGYDASITRALDAREEWEHAARSRWRHVFVDEAQDVLGDRAKLVCAVLEAVCTNELSGFTVLHDEAQAIHDYTVDGGGADDRLVDLIEHRGLVGERLELERIYRSREPRALALMRRTRRATLAGDPGALDAIIREHTQELSPHDVQGGELWLHRMNADVYSALESVADMGLPAWLRGSRRGVQVDAALGLALRGGTKDVGSVGDLEQRLLRTGVVDAERAEELAAAVGTAVGARRGRLKPGDVARAITRQGHRPVWEATPPQGVITLSTVHASKGHEAPTVRYFHSRGRTDTREELRVFHVALSRATEQLVVHNHTRRSSLHSASSPGRVVAQYGKKKNAFPAVEFGLEGDVDAVHGLGVLSRERPGTQDELAAFGGCPVALDAVWSVDHGRFFLLAATNRGERAVVGALSDQATDALRKVLGASWEFRGMGGLWWIGVATVALDPASSPPGRLRRPHAVDRAWLAPVIAGLGVAKGADPELTRALAAHIEYSEGTQR